MHKGFDGNTGEDIGRDERRQNCAQQGSSTCSIPPSQTSRWSTDTLSRTTTRRKLGSRQAAWLLAGAGSSSGPSWSPGQRWLSGGQPLVLGAVSPEAVVTCTTPPAVGSS
jgi:hypothetical protein